MNKPCCYCWQIYDERDKHECIGSLRAQRDKLLAAIKKVLADSESGEGWGPDITTCAYLRDAIAKVKK